MRHNHWANLLCVWLLLWSVQGDAGTVTSQTVAGVVPYRAVVSVDQTATEITLAFTAGLVDVYAETGSEAVYCAVVGTATAVGAPLVTAGQAYQFDRTTGGTAITRVSCICGSGNTATIRVIADRPR